MKPKPEQTREVTPPLHTRSPRARRQHESIVGFKEASNRERSRIGRNIEGNGPSKARAWENERRETNLPPTLGIPLEKERRYPTFAILLDLSVPPRLEDIVNWLRPMAAKRSFKSVVGKLLFASTAYFVWCERNNRLFKNIRRSPDKLKDHIMVVVRLKLITFRFKNKLAVSSMLAKWKLPNNFTLYGS
nr:hypothetical protein [Tanacetum cinerariifolium]